MSPSSREPVQEYYSIGEVCEMTDLKPHVLRYWESQFRFLNPAKNRSGNRVYQRREVELVLLVKHLLYEEKFTIEGARQKLDQQRRKGELKRVARGALDAQTIASVERELRELLELLDADAAEREPPREPAKKISPVPASAPRTVSRTRPRGRAR